MSAAILISGGRRAVVAILAVDLLFTGCGVQRCESLVHEAFMRLVGSPMQSFNGRGHFLAAAAEGMRRILVDYARSRNALKRGQGKRADFDWTNVATVADLLSDSRSDAILALDEALLRLEKEDPQAARLVRLRFFTGLSFEETADALGISVRSVYREWAFARGWLLQALRDQTN